MGGLIVPSNRENDQSLIAEPQREVLVPWIAVIMAGEIQESMMTVLCERLPETSEDPFVLLHNGSLGKAEIQESPGTITSDLTTEDITCRQLWNLGGHPQARASHRNTMPTNVTRPHLDTKRLTGKMDHRLGHLPMYQHPQMVQQLTLLVRL